MGSPPGQRPSPVPIPSASTKRRPAGLCACSSWPPLPEVLDRVPGFLLTKGSCLTAASPARKSLAREALPRDFELPLCVSFHFSPSRNRLPTVARPHLACISRSDATPLQK